MSVKNDKNGGAIMTINIEAVNELIKSNFRNNKSYFADEIGINRSYLTDILNGNIKENTPKVCAAIINFCKNRKMDYNMYIFF